MSIVLMGSTSGSCTLQEQAVAGTTTLTLPTFDGTVGLLVSGTSVASTSGTSIDFTGLPTTVRRITLMLNSVSTNGTSVPLIQLGTSSGVTTSGYVTTCARLEDSTAVSVGSSTAGFQIPLASASNVFSGPIQFSLIGSNTWVAQGVLSAQTIAAYVMPLSGVIALSATLDRVRVTTTNGTDAFDAGTINILYE